jgi:hypothetical protein
MGVIYSKRPGAKAPEPPKATAKPEPPRKKGKKQ